MLCESERHVDLSSIDEREREREREREVVAYSTKIFHHLLLSSSPQLAQLQKKKKKKKEIRTLIARLRGVCWGWEVV